MAASQIYLLACAILLCGAWPATPQGVAGAEARGGAVSGLVTDDNGAAIAGATVTWVQPTATEIQTVTGRDGQFSLTHVPAGPYRLTVTAAGFGDRTHDGSVAAGETSRLPTIRLTLAFAISADVAPTVVQVAEQQIKQEKQQRVLGIVPNYFVTYVSDAAPLTLGQKFELSRASLLDPVDFVYTGIIAAVQHKRNDYPGFGDGSAGYAKRYVAFYASIFTRSAIDQVLLPSLLKQDPRYFYKGTGSTASRLGYAVGTVFVRKSDRGHWQPNYSGILGGLATGALTNLYYPAADRKGVRLTLENSAIGLASAVAAHLAQEFLFDKLTTQAKPKAPAGQGGTPASDLHGSNASPDHIHSDAPEGPVTGSGR